MIKQEYCEGSQNTPLNPDSVVKNVGIKSRNSAIECLRILAMLAIVLSHACVHSGFNLAATLPFFNRVIVQWGVLGNLGVDIFVIISGYFLCEKAAKAKSITKMFVQIWFLSLLLVLVCRFGFSYHYSWKELITALLPTLFSEYWFFTVYVALAILSPYLNMFIDAATKKQFRGVLLCMIVMWVIIPTITRRQIGGGELAQFVMLYFIGAYFRKCPDNILRILPVRWAVTIGSVVLLFLSTVILEGLGLTIPFFQYRGTMFYERYSVLIVGCAVGMFSIAVYSRPFNNAFINTVSGCTFGVYLIHDNPVVRQILWKQIFPLANYVNSPFLIVWILGSVISVFSVCTLIEFLRQKTVAKSMTKALDQCNEMIVCCAKKLWNRKAPGSSESKESSSE